MMIIWNLKQCTLFRLCFVRSVSFRLPTHITSLIWGLFHLYVNSMPSLSKHFTCLRLCEHFYYCLTTCRFMRFTWLSNQIIILLMLYTIFRNRERWILSMNDEAMHNAHAIANTFFCLSWQTWIIRIFSFTLCVCV